MRSRLILILGAVVAAGVTPAQPLAAQTPRTLQDSLDAARKARLALEAAVERQLATTMVERARTLAMSNEATALQQLEALLDSAQGRLLVQRDRIRLLRDAATRTDKAILVILVRVENAPAGSFDVAVTLNGENQPPVNIAGARARALAAGGAEEVYRAEVVPSEHRISVSLVGPGISATAPIAFPTALREIRYVEFSLKAGRLVPTTWTSRASGY